MEARDKLVGVHVNVIQLLGYCYVRYFYLIIRNKM